jgi:hypothetical protein
MKKYSTCTIQYRVQFQGMTKWLKSCFSIKALHKQWKNVLFLIFTMKIIRTYLYINCNKKISFVKKYLTLLWVFTDFFLLLSEHKHSDNAATNSNRENARTRMVASLRRNVGTGTKEDESSIGRIWAAGFHHFTVRSRLARVLKPINCLFL